MNTEVKYLFPVLVLLLFQFTVSAQSTYQIGVLPSLNLNRKLNNGWSINTKLESRQLFQRGEINGNTEKEYKYILTDFSLMTAKKVGLNSRIAGGYLIRFEDGELFHRLIQQFVMIQKRSGFRLAHRLLSDQTFSEIEQPEFRFRYRITAEIPLNGESVDPGEFYLKLNNEYINSLQAMEYDLEVRLIPILGYDITENYKIESGMDYRVNSFLNNRTRHSFWMTFNLFIDI